MCKFCRHIDSEIRRLEDRRKIMHELYMKPKKRLKHEARKTYFHSYYERNKEAKKAAALARYYAKRAV